MTHSTGSSIGTLPWALAAFVLAGCAQAPADIGFTTTNDSLAAEPSPAASTDPRIVPIPPIPAALRGCWMLDDSEYPDRHDRLIVTESSLTVGGREAKPDYVNRVSEDWIDGRFAGADGDTIATMLEISDGEDGSEPGGLILREGDAGSYRYSRCRP